MKLRVGDKVTISAGKDKGKSGKITKILPQQGKIIVEGINKYKRHLKKQSNENPGGIVEIERALWASKVMLVCPTCKKPSRIGYSTSGTTKQRICKKCQAPLGKE